MALLKNCLKFLLNGYRLLLHVLRFLFPDSCSISKKSSYVLLKKILQNSASIRFLLRQVLIKNLQKSQKFPFAPFHIAKDTKILIKSKLPSKIISNQQAKNHIKQHNLSPFLGIFNFLIITSIQKHNSSNKIYE